MLNIDLSMLEGKRVIICVSGGVDSMVLLDLVCRKKDELNIDAFVCHFEHGIRGIESELDMELVERKCGEYGVPFYVRREDIPSLCGGSGVEETARKRRYGYFYECLKELGADCLVLAHHKGDNCETVLMNLIRGCGTKGLCGMDKVSGSLVRPLLGVSKEQLYEYAGENEIEYREDATNADVSYFRNSIRYELIPLLQKKNPRIEDAIDRLREIANTENGFLEEYVGGLDWINETFYGYDIEVDKYSRAHEAIKRRAVFYALRRLTGKDYDFRIYEDIDGLTEKETGKKVFAPHDIIIYKEENRLCFVSETEPIAGEYTLSSNGVTDTPFGRFRAETVSGVTMEELRDTSLNTAYFGIDTDEALTVRARRKGDRVRTFGGGTKKLKDILIDKKVPVFLREHIPVVCMGDEIIWVPGVVRGAGCPLKYGGLKFGFSVEK